LSSIKEAIHVRFNDYNPHKKLSKVEDSLGFDMQVPKIQNGIHIYRRYTTRRNIG